MLRAPPKTQVTRALIVLAVTVCLGLPLLAVSAPAKRVAASDSASSAKKREEAKSTKDARRPTELDGVLIPSDLKTRESGTPPREPAPSAPKPAAAPRDSEASSDAAKQGSPLREPASGGAKQGAPLREPATGLPRLLPSNVKGQVSTRVTSDGVTAPVHDGKTRCALCHTAEGWDRAQFAHERTGFPLKGAHGSTRCDACHGTDYHASLPKHCSACHRDPHVGEMGQRCEGCHDEKTFRTPYSYEAHRKAMFPLRGAHGAIPCTECHSGARAGRFIGTPASCEGCHLRDYERTRGTDIDHDRLGFGTSCVTCHGAQTFKNGKFAGHDACFLVSAGSHAGIGCRQCHRGLPLSVTPGACNTQTVSCSSCHEHSCNVTDGQHTNVAGYQCRDRKCVECHPYTPGRRP